MNVDQMIDDIIKLEGGYSNHGDDKGGATKYGMTQKTATKVLGFEPDILQMKALSYGFAHMVYKIDYYFGNKIDELPEAIQPQMLDIAINSGGNRAFKILQEAINIYFPTKHNILVDGIFGPKTMHAVNSVNDYYHKDLINNMVDIRKEFYHSIVARKPSQEVFLKGWLNRAEKFRQ